MENLINFHVILSANFNKLNNRDSTIYYKNIRSYRNNSIQI